jgi:acyl-CoA thioester hydrolase
VSDIFSVRFRIRAYEVDRQGHLNWAEYLHYAEQARWECLTAAGITQDALLATGAGPAVLDVNVKYQRELRGGDEVDVSCEFIFGERKTFLVKQDFRRPDGSLAAEVMSTNGLIDLAERRLVADPGGRMRALATDPALLGIA